MFGYVATVWNAEDPAARAQALALLSKPASAAGWRTVLERPGIEVRCKGLRPGSLEAYRLEGGAGVILGKLFARSGGGSRPAPSNWPGCARATAGGVDRLLIAECWGRYVAFLCETGGSIRVLRDPSGGLPCYGLDHGALHLYFSHMEDVRHLWNDAFTIDRSYVLAGLTLLREHSPRTGLCEVRQVMAGQCLEIRGSKLTGRFLWDPVVIAGHEVIEEPGHAAAQLGECVRDVMRAWAGCYRRVLLSLSGGLDSSIMLACLAGLPGQRLDCFHYYPQEVDLDERRFARAAAQMAGVALTEIPRPRGISLQPLFSIHPSPEPTNYLYYLEHGRAEAALAAERGADAVFMGYGGDQLFYQDHGQWAPGDFLRRRGAQREWLRVLLDSANMDQVSVWRLLGLTLRTSLSGCRRIVVREAARCRHLLCAAAFREAAGGVDCVHPLLREPCALPGGKLWHARQVVAPFDFYDPLGLPADPERVAPLLSQPLMELCLRIPTYVLTAGGWDRAIARRAFHEVLPAEIRNRRHKGGMEAHLRQTVQLNRAVLRELLGEGWLVGQGLLDRGRLARALDGAADIATEPGELLEYAGVEAWLRRWTGPRSSSAPPLWQTSA